MSSALPFCMPHLARCLLRVPLFGFVESNWPTKFLEAFIPAFLSTGLLLGIIYVLVMRAIRVDRQAVEDWFETQRQHLQAGPIPIIQKAQPVMLGGLYAIYGRSVARRFVTSSLVAALFTSAIFGFVHWQYKRIPASIRAQKRALEREVDPKLYSYVTDPQLRPEYEKSQEQEAIVSTDHNGEAHITWVYKYNGGIYAELRNRIANFQPELVAKLSGHPERVGLTLLFLTEGSYVHPGFEWGDSFSVFLFNIFLDFASVTAVITFLRRLGHKPTFRMAVVTFAGTLLSTAICAAISFFSYRSFFRGNTGFFWQAFIVLPVSSGAVLAGLGASIYFVVLLSRKSGKPEEDDWDWLLGGIGVIGLGCFGLFFVWTYWRGMSIGHLNWHDAFSFPYVLAGTTLIPATLSLIAFALMLAAKLAAEPARVLPEAYMTFVKEEIGGRQAAGIISLIGIIVGAIVGLVWSAK